jgi:hypothetical protein
MVKHAAHNLVLALTFLALTVPAGRAFAQSTTTTPTASGVGGTDPEPQGVGGTDPEPQSTIELIILQILESA